MNKKYTSAAAALGVVAFGGPFLSLFPIVRLAAAAVDWYAENYGDSARRKQEQDIEKAKSKAREEGRNEAKAEYAVRMEALLRTAAQRAAYDDLNIALYTVGIACLAHCGAAHKANVTTIKEIVFGATHGALPGKLGKAVNEVDEAPPNLATARARAHKIAPDKDVLFGDMVALAATLVDEDREHGLEAAWAARRAA